MFVKIRIAVRRRALAEVCTFPVLLVVYNLFDPRRHVNHPYNFAVWENCREKYAMCSYVRNVDKCHLICVVVLTYHRLLCVLHQLSLLLDILWTVRRHYNRWRWMGVLHVHASVPTCSALGLQAIQVQLSLPVCVLRRRRCDLVADAKQL